MASCISAPPGRRVCWFLPVDGSASSSLSVLSCRHVHEKQLETCILFSIRYWMAQWRYSSTYLNHSTTLKWEVMFTPWRLYVLYPLDGRLSGPQSRSGSHRNPFWMFRIKRTGVTCRQQKINGIFFFFCKFPFLKSPSHKMWLLLL
jgi:hypothetical protein